MSTHRLKYLRKIGKPTSESYSLVELAGFSGVPLGILQQVYNRGTGAWKSSAPGAIRMKGTFEKGGSAPKSARLSKEAWSYARVYSFLNKGTTYKTTDADLAAKAGY